MRFAKDRSAGWQRVMRWANVNSSMLCSASLCNTGLKRIADQVRLLLFATDPFHPPAPLESDFDGTAARLPNQVILFRFAHLWTIAPQKVSLFHSDLVEPRSWRPSRHLCSQCDLSLGSMTGQGVVWDQQYTQHRQNPDREHRTSQQHSTH